MRRSLRRLAVAAAAVTAAGLLVPPGAAAAEPDVLAVDFGETTGDFRGGASGTLYGFGDDGSPTQAVINGAHITNSSQKPPAGLQHPSGDVLNVENGFFDKHGRELAVYVQDFYPDWGYHGGVRPEDTRTYDQSDGSWTEGGNGVWDYLEVVRHVVTEIATRSDHPEDYLFVLFNEPDLIWYQDWPRMRERFLADWSATYDLVHEIYDDVFDGAIEPRIGGPGHSRWYGSREPADRQRERDILEYAVAEDVVPDTYIWHELGGSDPDRFRANNAEFRVLEDEVLGSGSELPVTISEWGGLPDMGTPGSIVRWFAAFEEEKVDAQTAYWNYAGNFSDNMARANGANGGWWLFKWYGDLAGAETVEVTPPHPDDPSSLRGIGAVDAENRRATVLYGGTGADVRLTAGGLDRALFGDRVDVEVREISLSGAEGLHGDPRLVAAHEGVRVDRDGTLADLTFPTTDADSAYQVLITPRQARDVERTRAEQPWSRSFEAEDTDLTQAAVRDATGHEFQASGDADVAWFNQVGSRSEFTVTVPRDGTYRLQVIGSAPAPGRHALFVDGAFAETVQYAANLSTRSRWLYRGSAEVEFELTAGEHRLSLRASRDGTTALPNSDITLDRYVLTDVTGGDRTVHPASTMRLSGGAHLTFDAARTRGSAAVAGAGQRADLYVAAWESGYHDLTFDFASSAAASATVRVNGVEVGTLDARRAGTWRATAPVHLAQGVNEVEISSADGVSIAAVTTARNRAADEAVVTVEAEDATLHGRASVTTLPGSSGTNASGGAFVGWLGDEPDNTLEIERRAGFDEPGRYTVVVRYANAELVGDHDYNPQVVDRLLQISEAGADGYAAGTHFRNNHHWDSFWERSMSVTLSTADGALTFGNDEPGAWAPNIDSVAIAPVALGDFTTTAR
ncbi:carbohydrate-binding protein [Streptomyces mayteni]